GDLEHAALLLRAPELGERVGRERRGEEDLDEDPGERLDDAHVEGAVHADDAAVDRDRIARLGPSHRLAERGAEGDATGIRVLDDHRRRLVELQHDGERRREIEEVIVAERRAVELPHRPEPVARPVEGRVERPRLVRVLPVAEPEGALGVDPEPGRPPLRDPGPRHRRAEGVERDDDEIDGRDPVLVERFEVAGDVPPRQNAAVNHRVKRLDAAVEHLRKPGNIGDVAHGGPGVPQELRGAAGRDDLDPESTEGAGELDHAGLVVDGDEGAADLHRTVTHTTLTGSPRTRGPLPPDVLRLAQPPSQARLGRGGPCPRTSCGSHNHPHRLASDAGAPAPGRPAARTTTLRPTIVSLPSANRRMASGYRRCSSTTMRADKDSSVSSGCTGTLAGKTIGPVSTPS